MGVKLSFGFEVRHPSTPTKKRANNEDGLAEAGADETSAVKKRKCIITVKWHEASLDCEVARSLK